MVEQVPAPAAVKPDGLGCGRLSPHLYIPEFNKLPLPTLGLKLVTLTGAEASDAALGGDPGALHDGGSAGGVKVVARLRCCVRGDREALRILLAACPAASR